MGGEATKRTGGIWKAVAATIGAVALYFRGLDLTDSVLFAISGVAATGAMIGGALWYRRRKAMGQAEAVDASGAFALDATLDLHCLPGRWPEMANETLHPLAAPSMTTMPVSMVVADGVLEIEKRKTFGGGRHPFRAEVALGDITSIDVQPAVPGASGSLLTISLGEGEWLQAEVGVARPVADRLVETLLSQVPTGARHRPGRGLTVTSDPPPPRTSYFRAFLLLMAPLLSLFAAVQLGWEEPAAAFAGLAVFMGVMVMFCWRPPRMHHYAALGMAAVAIAFAVGATSTGNAAITIGAATCLVAAVLIWRLRTPTWD